MNLCHRMFCSSNRWATTVKNQLLPWVLGGVELGDNVLEIGPGYGANIRVLIDKTPRYTAVEIDQNMADRLRAAYGDRAQIIHGDGTDTGLPAEEFSAVVCFTMLHHIPTAQLQDRLLAEAFRVLRPGGCSRAATALPRSRSGSCIFATCATRCRRPHFPTGCGKQALTMWMSTPTAAGCAGVR